MKLTLSDCFILLTLALVSWLDGANGLCTNVLCPRGTFCRVVQECRHCPAQSACLPCVPIGVDNVCHRHHYLHAVLTGNHFFPSTMAPRHCNPFLPFDCPSHSTCVPHGFGFNQGTCCYPRVPFSFPPVNIHPICQFNQGPFFNPLALTAAAALTVGTNE